MTRHLATLRALLSPKPTGVKTISQPGFDLGHRYIVVEPDPLPSGLGVGCGSLQCQVASITTPQKTFVRGWSAGPFGTFLAVGRCREGGVTPLPRSIYTTLYYFLSHSYSRLFSNISDWVQRNENRIIKSNVPFTRAYLNFFTLT